MKSIHKSKTVPTAETLALMADKGRDVSKHFTNHGKMMPAIRRVNVDFA
jgi:ribosomal protein S15P/S13E